MTALLAANQLTGWCAECLLWTLHASQLKALEQFEAKVCISFQQVALVVYTSERLKKLFMARLYKNTLK